MDQTPKDKIIGSDAWKQAIAKYKELPKWKDWFAKAPIAASRRMELNFYVTEFRSCKWFDRAAYLALREELENALDGKSLEYLIQTADKESARKHYKSLLPRIGPPIVYDEEIANAMMHHDRWAEFYTNLNDEDEFEGGTTGKEVRYVMELDMAERKAKKAKKDTAPYDEKRNSTISGFSRDAICFLCAAYDYQEDEEPLYERDIYLRQLDLIDKRVFGGLWVSFNPNNQRKRFDLELQMKSGIITEAIARYCLDDQNIEQHIKLSDKLQETIQEEFLNCDFISWHSQYGNPHAECTPEDWLVRVRYGVAYYPGNVPGFKVHHSQGYENARPRAWHHLAAILRALHKAPDGPDFIPDLCTNNAGGEVIPTYVAERLAFHAAFACAIPYGAELPQKNETTIVPLAAQESARKPNPDLALFSDTELKHFFKGEIMFSQTKLSQEATGFAVFRGKTLCFIFLCGTHEDAERILHRMPTPEVRFHAGQVNAESAMQKIAMILSGTALFNEQDNPPYAYFGHQAGIITKSEAFLTKDRKLDYMYLLCNSDEFLPRFVQTSY